jgi:hypothetical protein
MRKSGKAATSGPDNTLKIWLVSKKSNANAPRNAQKEESRLASGWRLWDECKTVEGQAAAGPAAEGSCA